MKRPAGATADPPRGRNGVPAPYSWREVAKTELYDLTRGRSKSRAVAAQHPDVVKQLAAEVERARAELGDALTKRAGSGCREPGHLAVPAKPE